MTDRDTFTASLMLLFAARYALRRQSTAPGLVASYIEQHPDILTPRHKQQLAADIRDAIANGHAGHPEIDVPTWRRVLAMLGENE